MKAEYVFPTVLIVIDLCAFGGDVKRAIYWIAAAVLNACVTF